MYEYRAIVSRIVDGDTIILDVDLGFNTWVRNESFRLFGIDAPETRTKDLEEKAKGFLSKDRLEELCPVNTLVLIRTQKSKDKYGRYLVEILTETNDTVNQILVREGYASVYR
jgi:micrococcal nuclease